ncbi:MAG TPA: hypothetical protein VKW08_00150 [Xanthobacteraceae bacterium]|nr:hypothetical protein [Xanthobacteraceae bacterium]
MTDVGVGSPTEELAVRREVCVEPQGNLYSSVKVPGPGAVVHLRTANGAFAGDCGVPICPIISNLTPQHWAAIAGCDRLPETLPTPAQPLHPDAIEPVGSSRARHRDAFAGTIKATDRRSAPVRVKHLFREDAARGGCRPGLRGHRKRCLNKDGVSKSGVNKT